MMACLSHNAGAQARIAKNAEFQSFIGDATPHGIIRIPNPEVTIRFFAPARLKEVRLMEGNVTISRPPRDRHMAVEILQDGVRETAIPWTSMPNNGEW